MDRVVGIRLRKSAPVLYASADDWELGLNDHVVAAAAGQHHRPGG